PPRSPLFPYTTLFRSHRAGQVGRFPLLTYDDARRHAAMIAEVVADRRMPPWHADPRYGHFRNDRHLSSRERATLLAWVEQGAALDRKSTRLNSSHLVI